MSDYQNRRTKVGRLLYKSTLKCGSFLGKHLWLYYILNYTWGFIMTFIGWIIIAFIKVFLRKSLIESKYFGPAYYCMIYNDWGGLELGKCFLVSDGTSLDWILHTKKHELGHTFQNAVLGPFFIFLVFIPSAIRYWYQRYRTYKGLDNKPYDLIWFEGSATDIGENYYNNYIEGEF